MKAQTIFNKIVNDGEASDHKNYLARKLDAALHKEGILGEDENGENKHFRYHPEYGYMLSDYAFETSVFVGTMGTKKVRFTDEVTGVTDWIKAACECGLLFKKERKAK